MTSNEEQTESERRKVMWIRWTVIPIPALDAYNFSGSDAAPFREKRDANQRKEEGETE